MKLWAIVDKDGEIMIAYPDSQFSSRQPLGLKELNTYDPATQVVLDRKIYNTVCYWIRERVDIRKVADFIKQFLSSGDVKK